VKKISKFTYFDDLLSSDFVDERDLLRLIDLGNISRQQTETKKSLVNKLLYESIYGLDEILNILFSIDELKNICKDLNYKNVGNNKNNLIGLIIKSLPPIKKRKIETVIEEDEEDEERLKIYELFVMYKNGACLFSYNLEPLEIGDSNLITSALNAITSLLQEITQTNSVLDSIDVQEKELIFEYIDDIIGVLLLNKETKFAKKLLRTFLKQFYERYKDKIKNFKGIVSYFENAHDLVQKNFSSYFYKLPKLI